MNKYELMFIIASDVSEEKREELIAKQKAYVEAHHGVVDGTEKVGMKKFAYPINFKNEGYYVLMNFNAPAGVPAELDRLVRIMDETVRIMTVRK